MNNTIVLKKAANVWEEAFPIGNGKIGGMVFGRTDVERIGLNIDELWSGYGKEKVREHSFEVLKDIRQKVAAGKNIAAEQQMKEEFLNEWNESYLPLGDLYFRFENKGTITDYCRKLKLDTGTAVCDFMQNGQHIRTEVFCPLNPQSLLVRISSDSKMKMEFWLDSVLNHEIKATNHSICLWGTAPTLVQPNYYECDNPVQYLEEHKGMGFCTILTVDAKGGSISVTDGKISVSDSQEIIACIYAETGYDMKHGTIGKKLDEVISVCQRKAGRLNPQNVNDIWEEHRKEFSELYNRLKIKLSEEINLLPTDERLRNFHKNHEDQGIIELFLNLGRYLLISCSRKDTMPANLQGIWNDKLRAPWSCNYTTNINLQMNYWIAEKSNLSDLHLPLFDFLQRCIKNGTVTAREQFGCLGWTANHNIDCWYQTSPVGSMAEKPSSKYGYFPTASGWLCLHIWEHYLYTKDKQFLKTYYPVLKEAALFYVDYLQDINGSFMTIPSTSPENLYYNDSKEACALSIGSTVDTAIIRMLFHCTYNAATVLNKDLEFGHLVLEMSKKMPDYQIGANGSLMEWSEDYKEVYPEHRHLSHLIGLYPGRELVYRRDLLPACAKTLENRTDEGTAWSKSWKACLWARLNNGEKAYRQLCSLLQPYDSTEIIYTDSGCLNNLLCTPPFQIDGNLGMSAAIMEMLVQDHEGLLYLLPAIPAQWKKGNVEGMKIVGGHTLSFAWNENKVTSITIKAGNNERILVYFNGSSKEIQLQNCKITNIYAE